jgi:hypothetical protein
MRQSRQGRADNSLGTSSKARNALRNKRRISRKTISSLRRRPARSEAERAKNSKARIVRDEQPREAGRFGNRKTKNRFFVF